jgi:CDP-4-dehydro-6-deoxyglucose reductase
MSREQPKPSYIVTVQPDGRRFGVESGETVLHAALRQDVALAWGCRFGGCGACLVKLRSGHIRYEENELPLVLTEGDAQADEIAICLAIPTSDIVIEIPEAGAGTAGETDDD